MNDTLKILLIVFCSIIFGTFALKWTVNKINNIEVEEINLNKSKQVMLVLNKECSAGLEVWRTDNTKPSTYFFVIDLEKEDLKKCED